MPGHFDLTEPSLLRGVGDCWLAGIALFDFKLRHVPGAKYLGLDGLSRRPSGPQDDEELDETFEEVEEWLDEALGCAIGNVQEVERHFSDLARTPHSYCAQKENIKLQGWKPEIPFDDNAMTIFVSFRQFSVI